MYHIDNGFSRTSSSLTGAMFSHAKVENQVGIFHIGDTVEKALNLVYVAEVGTHNSAHVKTRV